MTTDNRQAMVIAAPRLRDALATLGIAATEPGAIHDRRLPQTPAWQVVET